MPAIHVHNLTKEFARLRLQTGRWAGIRNLFSRDYTTVRAVNGVSFDIQQGELVGFIGPNGAGKSTTIKMLTGILVPTSGTLSVGGLVPYRDRIRHAQQIGVVFGQKTQLWWDVPLIESLRLLRDIYSVPDSHYKQSLDLFKSLLGIDEFLDTPVRQLSLGQRMRADLAAALLHSPTTLFLDEPTIGLDIAVKERLRQFILEINQSRRVTVILTTHDMDDVEKLCSRLITIDHGQIIYDGDVMTLRTRYGTTRKLVIEFAHEVPEFRLDNTILLESSSRRRVFEFNRFTSNPSDLIAQAGERYPISDLMIEEPPIESLVQKIYTSDAGKVGTNA